MTDYAWWAMRRSLEYLRYIQTPLGRDRGRICCPCATCSQLRSRSPFGPSPDVPF